MRIRLLVKLLVLSVVTVTTAFLVTAWKVSGRAETTVHQAAQTNLQQTANSFRKQSDDRIHQLRVVANALATFPVLRDLGNTNNATLDDTVADWAGATGAGLVAIVDGSGVLRARSDEKGKGGKDISQSEIVRPALEGNESRGIWVLKNSAGQSVYQVVAVPPLAPGSPILVVGYKIDDQLAEVLNGITGTDVAFLFDGKVFGAKISGAESEAIKRAKLERALPTVDREVKEVMESQTGTGNPFHLDLGQGDNASRYLANFARVGQKGHGAVGAVLLLSDLSDKLKPFKTIQQFLAIACVVAVFATAALLFLLARNLSSRIDTLKAGTERIQAGQFGTHLITESRFPDELTELSESFNHMSDGLRERFEMTKFVSRSTVEAIRRGDQGTSRAELTVLFSDVRGFTAFSSDKEPEEVVAAINTYLGLQAEVVKRHGGDVDKFIGDGMMAIFNGEEGPRHAALCGLEIFKEIAGLHALGRGASLGIGIGIAHGPAVVGSVGSAGRQDYTALGSTVNLSSRLCGEAPANEIYVDGPTRERLGNGIAAEALPKMKIKGYAEPVAVYRLTVA